jgi:hypothetical protein
MICNNFSLCFYAFCQLTGFYGPRIMRNLYIWPFLKFGKFHISIGCILHALFSDVGKNFFFSNVSQFSHALSYSGFKHFVQNLPMMNVLNFLPCLATNVL